MNLNFNEWYKYSDLLNLVNVVFVSRPKFKFSPELKLEFKIKFP